MTKIQWHSFMAHCVLAVVCIVITNREIHGHIVAVITKSRYIHSLLILGKNLGSCYQNKYSAFLCTTLYFMRNVITTRHYLRFHVCVFGLQ